MRKWRFKISIWNRAVNENAAKNDVGEFTLGEGKDAVKGSINSRRC